MIRLTLRATVLCSASLVSSVALSQARPACDADNGGITLPAGFCGIVVADSLGAARHIAIAPNGDLFVAIRNGRDPRVASWRCGTNRDGRMDVRERSERTAGRASRSLIPLCFLRRTTRCCATPFRARNSGRRGARHRRRAASYGASHTAKTIAVRGNDLFVNIGSPDELVSGARPATAVSGAGPLSGSRDACRHLAVRRQAIRPATDGWRAVGDGRTQRRRDHDRSVIRPALGRAAWAGSAGAELARALRHDEGCGAPVRRSSFRVGAAMIGWPYCFLRWDGPSERSWRRSTVATAGRWDGARTEGPRRGDAGALGA